METIYQGSEITIRLLTNSKLESQKQYGHIGIKVYFPPSNYSSDLKDNMLHHRSKPVLMEKNIRRFESAIMPHEIQSETIKYTIPKKWLDRL